jgi:hypothetical protein
MATVLALIVFALAAGFIYTVTVGGNDDDTGMGGTA